MSCHCLVCCRAYVRFDAVDGSSTGTSAIDVEPVEAPTIRRSQACKRSQQSVLISLSRSFRCTVLIVSAKCLLPAVEAPAGHSVFPEAADVPGRHRGVRLISLLVARAAGAWAQRAANAAGLCEAVRQAPEERHGRR